MERGSSRSGDLYYSGIALRISRALSLAEPIATTSSSNVRGRVCSEETTSNIMNTARIVRAAARARPASLRLPLQRRGYADAVSDKIKLTLALPHQVRLFSYFKRFLWPSAGVYDSMDYKLTYGGN